MNFFGNSDSLDNYENIIRIFSAFQSRFEYSLSGLGIIYTDYPRILKDNGLKSLIEKVQSDIKTCKISASSFEKNNEVERVIRYKNAVITLNDFLKEVEKIKPF